MANGFNDAFLERIFARERQPIQYENHPSFQTLVDYLHHEWPPQQLSIVSAHITTCTQCRERTDRIQNELNEVAEAMEQRMPDPLQYLESEQSLFQRLKAFLFSPSSEESSSREVVVAPGWARKWAFAASTLLIVALGVVTWLSFQVTQLGNEVAAVRRADTSELHELKSEIATLKATVESSQDSLAALKQQVASSEEAFTALSEQLAQQPSDVLLEGAVEESMIQVTIRKDLSGILRVYERVRGEILFAGIVKKGSTITAFGQKLEISWSVNDGREAVAINGWETVKRTDEIIKIVSKEAVIPEVQLIKVDEAALCASPPCDRFEAEFP